MRIVLERLSSIRLIHGDSRGGAVVRLATALALVAGLIAGALVFFGRGEPTAVDASGPAMSISVFSDVNKTQPAECNSSSTPEKCVLVVGNQFSIDVNASVPPPSGYTGWQISLTYTPNVNFKTQTVVWPDCLGSAIGKDTTHPQQHIVSCKTGIFEPTFSHYVGPLVNFVFTCKSGPGHIDLLGGTTNPLNSFYAQTVAGQGLRVFLKSTGELADTVEINCNPPTPTPTFTSTPTPTFTKTFTPTPTSTPTFTSTPTHTFTPTDTPTKTSTPTNTITWTLTPTSTPTKTFTPTKTRTPTNTPTATKIPDPSRGKMSLRVFSDTSKVYRTCDIGPIGRPCFLEVGQPFSVDVLATQPPPGGYTGYEIVLQYSGMISLLNQPGTQENRWPPCVAAYTTEDLTKPSTYVLTCKSGLLPPPSTYTGALANVHFVCKQPGTAQLDLVGGGGAQVSFYSRLPAGGQSLRVYLKGLMKGAKEVGDFLQITCAAKSGTGDTDGDGCTDQQENGPDEKLGGRRNFLNPWDYFNPTGDRINRVDDILTVIALYFHDVPDPMYDFQADRTLWGPNAWNLGPPNQQIRVDDILESVDQYFHDCA